jgi:hypothetical protein
MRKTVIAKALVLTIFGLYLAVAMVDPPNAKSDLARNDNITQGVVATDGQVPCHQAPGSG